VTNEDEANIMSALLAKKMGAKKTMVLIQRGAYVDLVQGGSIDIAISPAGHHLGPADPCAPGRHRQRLQPAPRGGRSHRGDRPRGREHLQGGGQDGGRAQAAPGTTIGAVVRGDEVLIAHDRTQIQQDDHVVMFLVDKKYIPEVERLFQPSPFFL
jgi:trk system potassium uptake protein TrkA